VYAYSPVYGPVKLPADAISALISLPGGKISAAGESEGTVDYLIADRPIYDIPADKILVVARGIKTRLITQLRQGDPVTLTVKASGVDLSTFDNVIGGGPFLVRNGQAYVDSSEQGFTSAFADKRHPRTAIGRNRKGEIMVVAVDGRLSHSVGASLDEMAAIMLRLGCVEAINLDGGGSTALNLRGVTVNKPSDKSERAVVNGVLFYADEPELPSLPAALVVPPGITVGEKVSVKVLLDGATVPNEEIIWGAQGAGWIDQGGNLRALAEGSVQITAYARGHLLRTEAMVSRASVSAPSPG